MASSSSSSVTVKIKYDVFLSFRGKDTRRGFTSHLITALERKQIKPFIDEEEIWKGDEISPTLLNAIETSDISIIIFSKDYASSTWCLDELVRILDCKKRNGQIVVPVFYEVNPSDVRNQTGSFGEAFAHHERHFPEKVQIQKWRDSLTQASNIAGFHDSGSFRTEAELVKKIAQDISKKLEDVADPPNLDGFVGVNSQIEKIKSLLCLELHDVRILGIWGMGGLGKTAIAEAVFHQIFSRENSNGFEGKCFMRDVREKSRKMGAPYVRDEVISQVLGENIPRVGTLIIPEYIKRRLRQTKVLIVLDDVDDNFNPGLESLVERLDLFSPGSRIIITTRDRRVLDKCGDNKIVYEIKGLEQDQACELILRKALRRKDRSDFLELSKKVACYADGNPLALDVLGSSFRGKGKEQWNNKLHELTLICHPRIFGVLKISYDELSIQHKNIFLDIACFFKGEHVVNVKRIQDRPWSLCYESALDLLVDKSLIKISDNRLQMQNLLQEVGKAIVHEESRDPGNRSRLWDCKDICEVLKNGKGTDAIQGIFLNLSETDKIYVSSEAFANMSNLKWLKFYIPDHYDVSSLDSRVHLEQNFRYLPEKLIYLHWDGYPLETLPFNFEPECLIELNLPYSKVKQIWEGVKVAPKLKFINLRNSQDLTNIPQPSEIPNLKELDLQETAIENVPTLPELRYLHLGNCKMLQSLSELPLFLEMLIASNCKRLQSLPELPSCPLELDTSIRETLSIPFKRSSRTIKNFIFSNCRKLNENANSKILADSKERIQHMIIQSLRRCQQGIDEEFAPAVEVTLCLPGSEIPDWFIDRSRGSSITLPLPQHCLNKERNLIGFALSVVIEFEKGEFAVLCAFEIKTHSETKHSVEETQLCADVSIDSDHVLLGFFPCWDVGLPDGDGEHPTTVSFQFRIENKKVKIPVHHKLRCCGVCPVFLSSNKTKSSSFTLRFGMSGPSRCVGRFDEEELEPAKRICRVKVNAE